MVGIGSTDHGLAALAGGMQQSRALLHVVLGTQDHRSLLIKIGFTMENSMAMKMQLRTAMMVVCVTFAAAWSSVHAQEIPVVTGTMWMQSSEPVKKAYLIGIANAIQVEAAYEGANPPSDAQSLVPRLTKGMKGQTLDSVRDGLDKWYAANPDKMQRPVIEAIWFEMVVPGLKK